MSTTTTATTSASGLPGDVPGDSTTTETPSTTEPTGPSAAEPTGPSAAEPTPPPATGYQPPPAGEPVDGDCPFLTAQQVADDTGQRIGQTLIVPGDPQPVCLFVRSDGGDLATVRALSFATPDEAAQAVDYYLPRDQSSLETKPDGWSGGSLRTDDGSIYGVSKGGYAVIATSNVMTVAARRLVVDAIAGLGW